MPRPTKVSEPLADRRSAPSTPTQPPTPSLDDLKEQLRARLNDQEQAEGFLTALKAARREKLVSASDADIKTHDEEIAAAERLVDRADAQVEAVHQALNRALEEDLEAPRRAAYEAARQLSDAIQKRLETEYPQLAAAIVSILRDVQEAETVVVRANRDLPKGAAPLVSPEVAVRSRPYQPRQLVSERAVERWVAADRVRWRRDETGRFVHIPVIPDENVSAIRSAGHAVERRKLYERTYHLPQAAVTPESLTKTVRLPGLKAGDSGYGMDRPDFLVGQQTEVVFELLEEPVSSEAA
jgi:hypothetical protein